MHKLLIWFLLAFMPVTGVRMVCIATAAPPAAPADDATAGCDQFCLRSDAPKPEAQSGQVDCMLVAGCSLLVGVSTVAVLTGQTSITFDLPQRQRTIEFPDYYLTPILTHHTPPPKG